MKQKISVSMDDKLIRRLAKIVKKGRYRNKSHIIEYAVATFIDNDDNNLV